MDFEEAMSGVVEQEAAAPAQQEAPESEQAEAATGAEGTEQNEQQPGMSEDKRWQIARQRAEREAKTKYNGFVARRFGNYKTPDGRPVQTMEDYFAALDAQQELARQQAVQQAARQMAPEQARQLVELLKNDPERMRLQAENDALRRQTMQAEGQQQFEEQLKEIGQLDPEVKSPADLAKIAEFKEFDAMVRSGRYNMVDAYRLACFDRLAQRQASAAKQAAINAAKGKAHLAPVGGGRAAEDGLTDEIIENYRRFNPKWTREEIARYHKSYKGA